MGLLQEPAIRFPAVTAKPAMDEQTGFGGGVIGATVPPAASALYGTGASNFLYGGNAIITPVGDIQKRGGTQRTSAAQAADATVTNGFCWRTPSTHEYLIACNTRLYSGGFYSLAMTWTDKGALATGLPPSFAAFRDATTEACYIACGSGLQKYGAGVLSAIAASPNVSQLAVYNQRLFGATGSDQTLYYSALNNGDTLGIAASAGGSAIVRTFGNQEITALLALRSSLAIFHVSGVSRFSGITQDDIAIQAGTNAISVDTGTVAARSIVEVEGVGYFLTNRGAFRITDAGVTALDSPEVPDPTVARLTAMSRASVAACFGVHDKTTSTIRWTLASSSSFTGGTLLYHYRLNAWSGPWTGPYTGTAGCAFDGVDDVGRPISLQSDFVTNKGYIARCDTATLLDTVLNDGSGGTPYGMLIYFRHFFGGSYADEKTWTRAYLLGTGLLASLTITWVTTDGSHSYTTPTAPADALTDRTIAVPLTGRGAYLTMSILDFNTDLNKLSRVLVVGEDIRPVSVPAV